MEIKKRSCCLILFLDHTRIVFDFNKIDADYEAYQYQKFDKLIKQLNLIKEYDYKYGHKTYLHPNLLSFSKKEKISIR